MRAPDDLDAEASKAFERIGVRIDTSYVDMGAEYTVEAHGLDLVWLLDRHSPCWMLVRSFLQTVEYAFVDDHTLEDAQLLRRRSKEEHGLCASSHLESATRTHLSPAESKAGT